MKLASAFGRTTPFIFLPWLGVVAVAAAAEPTGRWQFVDDGSSVEIAPCTLAADGLCGALVRLPKRAAPVTPAERKQLCGMTMIGSLKAGTPKPGEQARLLGWVIDPEDLARTNQPKRHAASLVLTSNVSARLDVHGPLNVVLESHRLMRPIAPGPACE
jgi:hypothetical protein